MKASKIFDNGSGDKYEVTIDFTTDSNRTYWRMNVTKRPKGKRKFVHIGSSDDDLRYKVPFGEREQYRVREYLSQIPREWVEEVIDEVTAKIRKSAETIYPQD